MLGGETRPREGGRRVATRPSPEGPRIGRTTSHTYFRVKSSHRCRADVDEGSRGGRGCAHEHDPASHQPGDAGGGRPRAVARVYEALGWGASSASVPGVVAFVRTAGPVLGLFPYGELQADAGLQRAPRPDGFGGITLAVNVETEGAVAGCLAAAVAAGGTLLKAATRAEWGGVTGYFADPDGYPWEVAYNPGFPFDDRGLLALPE